MATGTVTAYYPSEAGTSDTAGKCRISVESTWNDETNISAVTVKLQIYSAYTGNWQVSGSIKIDGTQRLANNDLVNTDYANSWQDAWTYTFNKTHGSDGKASVVLDIAKGTGQRFALINYNRPSYSAQLDIVSGHTIALHENDNGSKIYIGQDAYDCLIGNGSTFEKYNVKIGNGSAWENY